MSEFKLSYTGNEINEKLSKIDDFVTEEDVNEVISNKAVLYTEQNLTKEQRAQARANISEYDWIEFTHPFGAGIHKYSISGDTVNLEIADTIMNVTDGGDCSALEDLIDWLSYIYFYPTDSELINYISNAAADLDALVSGGAVVDKGRGPYVKYYYQNENWMFILQKDGNIYRLNTITTLPGYLQGIAEYDSVSKTLKSNSLVPAGAANDLQTRGRYAISSVVGEALTNMETQINEKLDKIQGAEGGMTTTEKSLILNLFRNAAYASSGMNSIFTQLETLWNGSDEGGGDVHSHSYTSSITTAATCTTAGVKTYTCSCGHSYTESIPATGHKYVDGVCTVCGAADPAYTPGVTLTSISATYSGGEVPVGTAVSELTGIVVTAHYSNGTSATVVGYTLSGTIAEGNNTITVAYEGQTATFVVVCVATEVSNETEWTDGVAYDYTSVENEYVNNSDGTMITYDGWCRTPHLYCVGASKIRIQIAMATSRINPTSVNDSYNAFYDENKNFIQNFSFRGLDGSTEGAYFDVDVPANAAYFIVSHTHEVICDTNGYGKAYIDIIPCA